MIDLAALRFYLKIALSMFPGEIQEPTTAFQRAMIQCLMRTFRGTVQSGVLRYWSRDPQRCMDDFDNMRDLLGEILTNELTLDEYTFMYLSQVLEEKARA